jgi:hypothetical protein
MWGYVVATRLDALLEAGGDLAALTTARSSDPDPGAGG